MLYYSLSVRGTFDGNVAHGCGDNGFAFYPKAYRPSTPAVVKNSYSFKNQGIGFRIGGTVDITLDSGVLSDNGKGGVESSGVLSGKSDSCPKSYLSLLSLTSFALTYHRTYGFCHKSNNYWSFTPS